MYQIPVLLHATKCDLLYLPVELPVDQGQGRNLPNPSQIGLVITLIVGQSYEDVEHSDLSCLNKPADSWLAHRIPKTKLRLFFMEPWTMFSIAIILFLTQKPR